LQGRVSNRIGHGGVFAASRWHDLSTADLLRDAHHGIGIVLTDRPGRDEAGLRSSMTYGRYSKGQRVSLRKAIASEKLAGVGGPKHVRGCGP
jgi:hypothetical protein